MDMEPGAHGASYIIDVEKPRFCGFNRFYLFEICIGMVVMDGIGFFGEARIRTGKD